MPHPLRDQFIDALAEFLSRDLAKRSIQLEMGEPAAREWARLYSLSGCRGYATKEEATDALRHLLFGDQPAIAKPARSRSAPKPLRKPAKR